MMNLDSATKILSEWRIAKKHRAEKMPDHLWDLVCSLTKQHSVQVVARTLGLASTQVRQQLKSRIHEPGSSTNVVDNDVLPFRIRDFEHDIKHINPNLNAFLEIFVNEKIRIRLPSISPNDELKRLLITVLELV